MARMKKNNMDTWPEEQRNAYPHPANRGVVKKAVAKLEKLPKYKRPLFEAKLAKYKCFLKQAVTCPAKQMTTFVNQWEDLDWDVKAIRPADERPSVKEWQKPADRVISDEEHERLNKLRFGDRAVIIK